MAVLLLALASVAARLWLLLDRPLWFDELFTVWLSSLPLPSLLAALARDSGPPLFYLLEKPLVLAAERLSLSDAVARALPFASTLALFTGALALPSRPARLRFAVLAATAPLLLLYSAEARAYALLALLVFLLFVLVLVVSETRGRLVAIVLLSVAALHTHYLALFAAGALVVVAAAEGRRRPALAVLAGSLVFLFWLPVAAAQPHGAVAWMHESAATLVTGVLSSFGGAGQIPPPFGPPLPRALFALGSLLALGLAFALGPFFRRDRELTRAGAFLVLFFGGVLFASLARPIAFAGRTEMTVLPVWLWMLAVAADRSRVVRVGAAAVALVAALSSALLVAEPRGQSLPARALAAVEAAARPGDVLFAGAHFFLPARLAADRGRLAATVHAFPLEQAAHPGWTVPTRPRAEDVRAVEETLDRAAPGTRVFFQVPPSYRVALSPLLAGRGATRRLAEDPEMLLLAWSRE